VGGARGAARERRRTSKWVVLAKLPANAGFEELAIDLDVTE